MDIGMTVLYSADSLCVREHRDRDIETFHFSFTPSKTETFRKIDFSFRSPGKRFLMRWSALEAAADSTDRSFPVTGGTGKQRGR